MQFNFRGIYDSNLSYQKKDVVSYQSTQSSPVKYYFCLMENDNTNIQLPNPNADTEYWAIINTLSNFPNNIDTFLTHNPIQASDITDINRYQELILKTNRTSAEDDELNNLIQKLRDKLILPEDWNKLQESISNLQMFFKTNVEGYINQKQLEFQAEINKFSFQGVYSPIKQYYAKNYVVFNDGGGDNIYICIKDSLGFEPTNTTYWRKLGIKGERGEAGNDGVGLIFRGAWSEIKYYQANDAVQLNGVIFGALVDNIGQMPDINQDTPYWAKAWDIAVTTTELKGVRTLASQAANVNFFVGDIKAFNPLTDTLEVRKNTTVLAEKIQYNINPNNQSIDCVDGIWDGSVEPILFEFVVTRNQINNLVFSDGQSIQDKTISKNKLTVDLQDTLDQIEVNSNNVGILSNLTTVVKSTLVNAINEIVGYIGGLGNLATTVKDNLVSAINELKNAHDEHLAEIATQDKLGHIKLSDIPPPYVHPTGAGWNHIPAGGAGGQFLAWDGVSGKARWEDIQLERVLLAYSQRYINFTSGYTKEPVGYYDIEKLDGVPYIYIGKSNFGLNPTGTLVTDAPVDLTGWHAIQFRISGTSSNTGTSNPYANVFVVVSDNKMGSHSNYIERYEIKNIDDASYVVPISVSGNYYIRFHVFLYSSDFNASAYFKEVKLLK